MAQCCGELRCITMARFLTRIPTSEKATARTANRSVCKLGRRQPLRKQEAKVYFHSSSRCSDGRSRNQGMCFECSNAEEGSAAKSQIQTPEKRRAVLTSN